VTTPPVVVQKFGGTSVSTLERRRQVVSQVERARGAGYRVTIVVSAMGRRGDPYATDTLLDILRADGGPVHPADYDLMFACGEMISAALMSQTLRRAGIPALGLTAAQAGIFTDSRHLESEVTRVETGRLLALMAEGIVPVVCGGQGVTPGSLDFTTLGRGGSDTSGVVLGVALGARLVEIFTDVEGVMTADPRAVPGARLHRRIGYRSCHELARFGATVIHPRALAAGWRARLPIVVRSTSSGAPGTTIDEPDDEMPVAGIALLPSMRMVSLGSRRLDRLTLEDWERQARVLAVADEASGHLLVGAPADKADALAAALAALEPGVAGDPVDCAWISVVGQPQALAARHADSVIALSAAGCRPPVVERSECRTTFVVDPASASRAVAVLHRQHFG